MLYCQMLIYLKNQRLKGNFACESDVVWLKLGWAHDVTGRNLLVVNTPRYPQIHRLETCRYRNGLSTQTLSTLTKKK